MKLYLLKQIANRWNKFKKVNFIRRVLDNEILISFDLDHLYQVDLNKSKSNIYMLGTINSKPDNKYNAPFDKMLFAKFQNSSIVKIEALEQDRIIRLVLSKKYSYKEIITVLQLEFTGRNTNAIILEDEIIKEALRHINKDTSFRAVQPNIKLKSLKAREIIEDFVQIDNIDGYLKSNYELFLQHKMQVLKEKIILKINKNISTLEAISVKLHNEEVIKANIEELRIKANLILSNAQIIDIYSPTTLIEGVRIDIPIGMKSSYMLSNHYFKKSKKQKAVLENIYLQKENIEQKKMFLIRQKNIVSQETSIENLSIFVNKKTKKQKHTYCEEFYYSDFKIMIGRNSIENAKILKISKKNDLWLHIKDQPSSHVIIVSNKQQFPDYVIKKSAMLCVATSVSKSGTYVVDYTSRHNVKVKSGSNVTYVNFKSIIIKH